MILGIKEFWSFKVWVIESRWFWSLDIWEFGSLRVLEFKSFEVWEYSNRRAVVKFYSNEHFLFLCFEITHIFSTMQYFSFTIFRSNKKIRTFQNFLKFLQIGIFQAELTRDRRQSSDPDQLCPTVSQYIMPRAAVNTEGLSKLLSQCSILIVFHSGPNTSCQELQYWSLVWR